ncbi:conjugal transfer protein [Streptomyces sp. NPDC005236]|uniref:conjugal transfer protein n=1 Tax=Streptomyces sp. NPDC005236 TaxID=3157028 RepID=UPI0033AD05BF
MPPDKLASENSAAGPVAAGLTLGKMRRRVRLSRLAVMIAIAAGPIALCLSVTSAPTTVAAATSQAAPTRTAAVEADPAGYAQVFVDAWLRSSAEDSSSAQARLAQSMGPDVELPDREGGAHARLESVTVVRSAQRSEQAWLVTVAAQYADGSLRNYAVPVVADRDGGSFTVAGSPCVVSGPVRADVPPSPYQLTVPDGDLVAAVGEFLSAYLAGAGEVDRYLAPGVALSPVAPVPYTRTTVQQVQAIEAVAAAGKVAADGTVVHILARVEARDEDGRWPLAYELTLAARSGRWEVAGLESGTVQGGGRS